MCCDCAILAQRLRRVSAVNLQRYRSAKRSVCAANVLRLCSSCVAIAQLLCCNSEAIVLRLRSNWRCVSAVILQR
jgi:hypothetical protein